MEKPFDIVGLRFGSIVAEECIGIIRNEKSGKGRNHYRCKCDCGNEKIVSRRDLLTGHVKTCGRCKEQRIVKENDYYRCFTKNGKSFIFDKEDLPLVKNHMWWVSADDGYAMTWLNGSSIRLTRLQYDLNEGDIVDHIDGNRCNNRRSNQRIVSKRENNWNRGMRSNNTTGYVGIYRHKKNKNYVASIVHDGIKTHIGCFDTPEKAARAYDEAARYFFGQFACVNFPREGEQCCLRNQI